MQRGVVVIPQADRLIAAGPAITKPIVYSTYGAEPKKLHYDLYITNSCNIPVVLQKTQSTELFKIE